MSKKLYRPQNDRKIAGLCSGIGYYLNVDPTIIRLICLFLILFGGLSLWVYIIACFIIPTE
ncbi:PspC domain-containing protein [Oceanirhabdus seepicola]|uniref:PspC domain-containing protein n=1 Tax=Oceanirhabdus seepicola TaxID=2828781 RepID=A0A9J6P997_9CLOT|nr:PspC domain-containing protein [Oceanirhabdus seepicola]MCM1991952.1 PspC domain-containing protein [Oceanirhabdus seepicola]